MAKKKRKKAGLAPGSLVFTGRRKLEKLHINVLQYNAEDLKETPWEELPLPTPVEGYTNWYDIRGLHEEGFMEQVGRQFDIHPLVFEDILNVHQRPKLEVYEKGVFITFKAVHYQPDKQEVQLEHVALYFNAHFCITFQEDAGDLYGGVRERLRRGSGKIRQREPDYLAYALLDETVDKYFHEHDQIEEVADAMEEQVLLGGSDSRMKAQIHQLRKELLKMRRAIAPLREAIAQFARQESPYIKSETVPFVRDVYDHIIQILENTEQYRELLNSLHEMYLSEISFSMNKIIHVLTLVSTVFIPLSFLAGLYGMNFQYMPELQWRYGYFALLGVMALIVVGMLIYFRRNKWL